MNLKTMITSLGLAAMATGAQATELKLADFSPPTHFVVESTYQPMMDAVAAATDGEVTIRLYMGGELGPGPGEQYNRALDGVSDISFSLPGYTASNFPKTLLGELPGVLNGPAGTQSLMENRELYADEFRRVQLLSLWNNAPNLLFMADTPVEKLEDLAGLNIRVPSRNAGLVVEAWGANPVSMPAPEIYNAMQTGVIDGAMIDATSLGGFKLGEVTGYVTQGMDTTVSEFFLVMNRDAFADLTEEQQAAVLAAGEQAAMDGTNAWHSVAEKALAGFEATEGKTVITLSPEEAEKFNAASAGAIDAIIAEAEGQGIDARAIIDAFRHD
ncbi:MAG: TRAP transporter substrate-binding protein [Pseudomonadota bacterium]|nr:TRAP transporter substrate-binding protein [Pseudomonadota bacterium]